MQLLPGFEPSEADLIQMALDMPLERKIEKAILFYQEYCDGAYGAFSGGKDSCVIKQLAIDAGVSVDWHYNNVTIDPPELVRFIREHHSEVKWNNPKIGLLNQMVEKNMPPTRLARWCCTEYKEQGGDGQDKILGVRIAESAARSKRWSLIVPHRKTGKLSLCPIVYWTDKDVWDYIKLRWIPYCSLYDEVDEHGKKVFTRLGCVGCPLNSARAVGFKRWPRFEKAWKRAFEKTWNKWHGVPTNRGKVRAFEKCGSWEAWYEWWISNAAYSDEVQCVFDEMMEQR